MIKTVIKFKAKYVEERMQGAPIITLYEMKEYDADIKDIISTFRKFLYACGFAEDTINEYVEEINY